MIRNLLGGAALATLLLGSVAKAEENPEPRNEYHVSIFGGMETSLVGQGSTIPLAQVQVYSRFPADPSWDFLGSISTSGLSVEFLRRGEVDFGVRPFVRYIIQGNYLDFNQDGSSAEEREVQANELGVEVFSSIAPAEHLELSLMYSPYAKVYGFPSKPETNFPSNHFEQQLTLEADISDLEQDVLLQRKEGFEISGFGEYAHRPGFKSNIDGFDDKEHSLKLLMMAGVYFQGKVLNLHLQGRFGTQQSVDIFNALYQGGFMNSQGAAPGTYYDEFRHSTWAQANLSLGFLIAKHYHLRPEVGVLTLLGDNQVEGSQTFDTNVLPNVGLSFNSKIGGLVPFGIRYGWSPTSPRVDKEGNTLQTGGHSILVYAALAFGKVKKEE